MASIRQTLEEQRDALVATRNGAEGLAVAMRQVDAIARSIASIRGPGVAFATIGTGGGGGAGGGLIPSPGLADRFLGVTRSSGGTVSGG
jgi:hypothetical protein